MVILVSQLPFMASSLLCASPGVPAAIMACIMAGSISGFFA
jgi:hypothetical protein